MQIGMLSGVRPNHPGLGGFFLSRSLKRCTLFFFNALCFSFGLVFAEEMN